VVGGMEIPPVVHFAEGYRNGAQCANGRARVLINYTGTFVEPNLGAQVAQQMIAQGADVIFGAAGSTGNGAILTATQSGRWGIGVDSDQYYTLFDNGLVAGANKLLSSAVKRVDNATYDSIADVISGTFTSGNVLYSLVDEGVGLAPFHGADLSVPQDVRNAIEAARQGIINGAIDVNEDCRVYLYLPLIRK
jgi:basic membrane protein A and related proteins